MLCFDDDTAGLSFALTLLPRLKPFRVPILLMNNNGGLTYLILGKPPALPGI